MALWKSTYLSGPISGCPDGNQSSFTAAEKELRSRGLEVVNPHTLCADMDEDSTQEEYLLVCLRNVLISGRVIILEGWERSRGAHSEVITAIKAGIPVFDTLHSHCHEETLIPVGPDQLPNILTRLAGLEKEYILDTLR